MSKKPQFPKATGFTIEELTQIEVSLVSFIQKLAKKTKGKRNITATIGVSIYADLLLKVQTAITNLEFMKGSDDTIKRKATNIR